MTQKEQCVKILQEEIDRLLDLARRLDEQGHERTADPCLGEVNALRRAHRRVEAEVPVSDSVVPAEVTDCPWDPYEEREGGPLGRCRVRYIPPDREGYPHLLNLEREDRSIRIGPFWGVQSAWEFARNLVGVLNGELIFVPREGDEVRMFGESPFPQVEQP